MSQQQPPPVFQPPPSNGVPVWAIVLIVLLSLPLLACGGCLLMVGRFSHNVSASLEKLEADRTPEERAKRKKDAEQAELKNRLIFEAERGVRSVLKSPGSAGFDWFGQKVVLVEPYAWVSGKVTAKNAFNAELQQDYTVTVMYDSEDVKLVSVKVGDESTILDQNEHANVIWTLAEKNAKREAAATK